MKVVSFTPKKPTEQTAPEPSEDVIAVLEEMLDDAVNGYLQHVVVIGIKHDGNIMNAWSVGGPGYDTRTNFAMIGAIEETKGIISKIAKEIIPEFYHEF